MKIVLDPQIFNQQKFGGISRYYTEIFSILAQTKQAEIIVPLKFTSNVYFRDSVLISSKQVRNSDFINFLSGLGISLRSKIRKANAKTKLKTLKETEFDLFIPTYYDTDFLDLIGDKPFVLTVYDMIHELFPQYFPDDTTTVENKKRLLEKATKVIAVSSNTKKDILKIYPHIDENKIEVIFHGSSIEINKGITVDLPKKYLLFVGARGSYKNFEFFIESVKPLMENDKELFVVAAGGGKFSKREIKFLEKSGLEKQVIQKNFKEEELGLYYKNAVCFVFPSEYEGFGIPVLESMTCGCPIVLTNASSFPEVASDAGIFFELNDSADLKAKIEILLSDEKVRAEYSRKGLERSGEFSWNVAAEQCLKVYTEAVGLSTKS